MRVQSYPIPNTEHFHLYGAQCLSLNVFKKEKNVNILNILHVFEDGSRQFWWTLTYQRQFLDVMQRGFAVKIATRIAMIGMKRFSSGVSFCSVCPISGGLKPTLFARNDWLFGKQLFYEYKMKSIIINVETNFRHANPSSAFVSGRLLRFHIPKFHHISVTCWCLLQSDHINTS